MRSASDLRRLYDYNYWANGKLLAVVSQLTPEEFTREVSGSYGSIRNSLVHVLSAEWGWLDRCGGRARGRVLVTARRGLGRCRLRHPRTAGGAQPRRADRGVELLDDLDRHALK